MIELKFITQGSRFKAHGSRRKTLRPAPCALSLLTCALSFLTCALCLVPCALSYAQNAKARVPADVTAQTIILEPQASAPASCNEGQIYYNSTDHKLYYNDGSGCANWKVLGQGDDRTVATKIVAAYNSLDSKESDGTVCEVGDTTCDSPRADYTCDGVNDHLTIQQAIDALPAYNPTTGEGGGVVYLLEGTYNISGAINLDNTAPNDSNKALIGAGRATVLKLTSGASNVNVINTTNVNRILILQLMIDGNSKTGSNNNGIYFNTVTNSKIAQVWVENMVANGIYLQSSTNNNVINNHMLSNGKQGLYTHSSSNNTISQNIFASNGDSGAMFSNGSNNNIISDNLASSNYQSGAGEGAGISMDSSNSNAILSNELTNNKYGVNIWNNCRYSIISGNIASNNTAAATGGHGIYIEDCFYTTVTNNVIRSNRLLGIFLYRSSDNIISGNLIQEHPVLGGGIIVCFGSNDCVGAISLFTNSHRNVISSNYLSNNSIVLREINISSVNCQDNYLIGNLMNSAIIPIRDEGITSKYTDKVKITLQPGSYSGLCAGCTLTPANYQPTSYLKLAPTANVTLSATQAIEDGKAAGDLLILENTATYTVQINDDADTRLSGNLILGQFDTLTLIYDGFQWLQIGYTDNN